MALIGLENKHKKLFTELANAEIDIEKSKHPFDKPRLLTDQLNAVRNLSKSLDKKFNSNDEKLDAIRDVVRFDQINTEVSLKKLARTRSQKTSLRSDVLDAQAALNTIEIVRSGSSYRHAIEHHMATIRKRGTLPADQLVTYLEKRSKTVHKSLLTRYGAKDHAVGEASVSLFKLAKSKYQEVQQDMVAQIEKELKAEKRKIAREKKRDTGLEM